STYQGLSFIFSDWRLPVSRNRNFLPSDLKNLLDNQGVEAVLQHVDEHFKNLSEKYGYTIKTPENKINELGYLSLSVDDIKIAIQIFERNVKDYPESANVYDSLADALSADGQLERAKLNYYKAVEKAQSTNNPTGAIYKRKLDRIKEILREQKDEERALIKKTGFEF
ncbi:MAG: hypothetical protein KDD94_09255, partial [Calditrichaeota bacterium]|nr:hypothetical protein [Calditrichota bacterium]